MKLRLVLVPALISLAVTLLRLTGELKHWPVKWFSTETSSVIPVGVSWVIGITWLAGLFGVYFAIKLMRTGHGPASLGKAAAFSVIGVLIYYLYYYITGYLASKFDIGFPHYLIVIWLLWALGAALQYFGWRQLFKVLLVYGYAARIPVAIVMLFAMMGHWGTHYDYVGIEIPLSGPSRYLWMAFFPQLVAWVAFTITFGTFTGILAIAGIRLSRWLLGLKTDRIDVSAVS